MNLTEVVLTAKLEGTYAMMRKFQGESNEHTKTPCIGSGNCCKIGLRISLLECFNIAKQIQRQYWLDVEDQGKVYADGQLKIIEDDLVDKMWDEAWDDEGHSTGHCVFYKGGCTIYEFRPMVCRAFGTTMTVDKKCPRPRLDDGDSIELISSPTTKAVIKEFDSIIEQWGEYRPELNYAVYMPMGVLRFLWNDEPKKLEKLQKDSDPKFWTGAPGYSHHMSDKIKV